MHLCLQVLPLTYQTKTNMENNSMQLSKEYILDLMEQIKDALENNDFDEVQNLSDLINRECNEFID